jgi:hypothetical protein
MSSNKRNIYIKSNVDKREQLKIFNYVNSHLTLMENSCDDKKSLFTVKESNEKVVIPEPRYQSSQKSRSSIPSGKRPIDPYVYSSYHDFDCTICMENIRVGESVQKLTCGHMFHANCLQWFQSDPDSDLICPTCEDEEID